MIGVFLALDLVLFFVFFEFSLIPMYLLIGKWGGANRVYAALKFFVYTFAGSALMLVAILVVYFNTGTFNLLEMDGSRIAPAMTWAFLAFTPSPSGADLPVHTGCPDATCSPHRRLHHPGRRPPGGDLWLPALRHSVFPEATRRPWIVGLAVIGILWRSSPRARRSLSLQLGGAPGLSCSASSHSTSKG